jgi:Bacteriocin-protection, YdeI or OmpD-Associated
MAAPVPTDLEDALAADPAARESFGAMPPAERDAWIAWLDRACLPLARRRRVADAARRLGGTEAVRDTRVVAPPRETRGSGSSGSRSSPAESESALG